MFATSDDNAMLRQVQATHAPDGREFNVKPLLYIIEDIFQRAAPSFPGFIQETQAQLDVLDDKAFQFNSISEDKKEENVKYFSLSYLLLLSFDS